MNHKMKNIHLIPSPKPSRLLFDKEENRLLPLHYEPVFMEHQDLVENQNIYITSDEEIKEGDWIFDLDVKKVLKADNLKVITSKKSQCWYYKKIILTDNKDLIGVQAIDDEFLEWFIKNPSCEEVEVFHQLHKDEPLYKIIIPKEEPKQTDENGKPITYWGGLAEPKQETLEEAAKRYTEEHKWEEQEDPWLDFMEGAKWQQERSYSEAIDLFITEIKNEFKDDNDNWDYLEFIKERVIEQFKKK
jgi:hypothetical protein